MSDPEFVPLGGWPLGLKHPDGCGRESLECGWKRSETWRPNIIRTKWPQKHTNTPSNSKSDEDYVAVLSTKCLSSHLQYSSSLFFSSSVASADRMRITADHDRRSRYSVSLPHFVESRRQVGWCRVPQVFQDFHQDHSEI